MRLLWGMTPASKSMSELRKLFFLSLLAGLSGGVWAEEPAQEVTAWLHRMGQAVHELNYEGTFVYLLDSHVEAMHLLHTAQDGQERERLVSLNGMPRQVVRDNYSIICVLPDRRSVSAELRSGAVPNETDAGNLAQLAENYEFHLFGTERVAGRQARVILIVPHDNLRYGHRLFLDVTSALPLKSELLDEKGKPISQIMFTELRIAPNTSLGDSNSEESMSLAADDQYAWVNQKPSFRLPDKSQAQTGWVFSGLPKGFRLRIHSRRAATKTRSAVDHFVFSDGLATLSVYVEKEGAQRGLNGASQVGTLNAFGINKDGYQITAVGEVPPQTVQQLTQTIELKSQDTAND